VVDVGGDRGTGVFQSRDRVTLVEGDGGGGDAGEAEGAAPVVGAEELGRIDGAEHDGRHVAGFGGRAAGRVRAAELLDDFGQSELDAREALDEVAAADFTAHLEIREDRIERFPGEGGALAL
jgi:hypothetical protein